MAKLTQKYHSSPGHIKAQHTQAETLFNLFIPKKYQQYKSS
jgi:hypothetical protein